ncbi:MAG: hypothetical protein QOF13_1169 [Solirubrobacterales bacterium]|jgi:hypothetical protein|nr:hypothetical protein [Solirubrobacterales bacterium]
MKRIKRGWGLTKKSWALLREHRELIRFPLYGAVATIPLAILFLGPGLYFLDQHELAGAIPLLVIGIYVLTVVGVYFSVGLAAAANLIFGGQEATVSDGLAVARSRFSQICGWAALSTAISVLMGVLENQGGALGNIAARLVGMAWALVTFMAVPVIAIEGTGPLETLKRSATIFKDKWGQQITGNIAIGGAVFLIGVLPAALLIVAGVVLWPSSGPAAVVLILIGAVVMCVALLISKALSGVFGVALYRYAVEGQAVGGFTQEELESAVRLKKGRKAPPTATPGTV